VGDLDAHLDLRLNSPLGSVALLGVHTKGVTMMSYRIFLAGASGAIGRRLTPLLHSSGHYVCGSTRLEANTGALRALGADPVVVDVLDASALSHAVASARPDVVIHQLTDLPKDLNPREMGAAIVRTARIRSEGTRNLVVAAIAAGARRLVAQSIAWVYAPGPEPHAETDPLDTGAAEGESGINMQGVIALEDLTLKSPPLEGVVLRYGQLYGPGTASDRPSNSAPIHVDAAAYAALLAIDHGDPGIYNIAQSNRHVATEKARADLGWTPDFRLPA
jgi:nucleoside-diphosphate-sugar epimerase